MYCCIYRRHKITGYSSVCCEVLQVEENLPTTSVTFYMRIKKPGVKDYESPREVEKNLKIYYLYWCSIGHLRLFTTRDDPN